MGNGNILCDRWNKKFNTKTLQNNVYSESQAMSQTNGKLEQAACNRSFMQLLLIFAHILKAPLKTAPARRAWLVEFVCAKTLKFLLVEHGPQLYDGHHASCGMNPAVSPAPSGQRPENYCFAHVGCPGGKDKRVKFNVLGYIPPCIQN